MTCGSKSQPWTFEAPGGQQIIVTLVDFTVNSEEFKDQIVDNLRRCNDQLGYVLDRSISRNVSICRGSHERRSDVYTSRSNAVQIVLADTRLDDPSRESELTFLLGFVGNDNELQYYSLYIYNSIVTTTFITDTLKNKTN